MQGGGGTSGLAGEVPPVWKATVEEIQERLMEDGNLFVIDARKYVCFFVVCVSFRVTCIGLFCVDLSNRCSLSVSLYKQAGRAT